MTDFDFVRHHSRFIAFTRVGSAADRRWIVVLEDPDGMVHGDSQAEAFLNARLVLEHRDVATRAIEMTISGEHPGGDS